MAVHSWDGSKSGKKRMGRILVNLRDGSNFGKNRVTFLQDGSKSGKNRVTCPTVGHVENLKNQIIKDDSIFLHRF